MARGLDGQLCLAAGSGKTDSNRRAVFRQGSLSGAALATNTVVFGNRTYEATITYGGLGWHLHPPPTCWAAPQPAWTLLANPSVPNPSAVTILLCLCDLALGGGILFCDFPEIE